MNFLNSLKLFQINVQSRKVFKFNFNFFYNKGFLNEILYNPKLIWSIRFFFAEKNLINLHNKLYSLKNFSINFSKIYNKSVQNIFFKSILFKDSSTFLISDSYSSSVLAKKWKLFIKNNKDCFLEYDLLKLLRSLYLSKENIWLEGDEFFDRGILKYNLPLKTVFKKKMGRGGLNPLLEKLKEWIALSIESKQIIHNSKQRYISSFFKKFFTFSFFLGWPFKNYFQPFPQSPGGGGRLCSDQSYFCE